MTRMAEQEIKDTLKKSDFRNLVGTVLSTATIVVSLMFGGNKIINEVKDSMRSEIRMQIEEQARKQALIDLEQDRLIFVNQNSNRQK